MTRNWAWSVWSIEWIQRAAQPVNMHLVHASLVLDWNSDLTPTHSNASISEKYLFLPSPFLPSPFPSATTVSIPPYTLRSAPCVRGCLLTPSFVSSAENLLKVYLRNVVWVFRRTLYSLILQIPLYLWPSTLFRWEEIFCMSKVRITVSTLFPANFRNFEFTTNGCCKFHGHKALQWLKETCQLFHS